MNTGESGDTLASLEATSATYTRGSPQDCAIRGLIVRTFAPYLRPDMCGLQLGYAEGVDTALLAPLLDRLDVVEGSRAFYEAGRAAALANVTIHHDLFERFLPKVKNKYAAVFAVYVLEHVQEPVALLRLAKDALADGGLLFVAAPNARALSRQLALKMGLLPSLYSLTPRDLEHGHRRVYDSETLQQHIRAAGLNVIAQGGVMLKILADFQLDELMRQGILGEAQIDGLYALGHDYPDLCGSLYAVCGKEQAT
ncbi:MAG TPA: class I SAM-dependent methyltransferase [Candidatus Hydrogenedentes bacterium]|nr:class I SAM-dependent methyltransferase [Candidatus Hydrogenedentota bacterium]